METRRPEDTRKIAKYEAQLKSIRKLIAEWEYLLPVKFYLIINNILYGE